MAARSGATSGAQILGLKELRRELRGAKQFALADLVADRLAELRDEVRDSAEGTDWVWRR